MKMKNLLLWVVFVLFAINRGALAVESEYKAEFFSFDGPLRTADSSHTFARFTKLESGRVTETIDLSWFPDAGNFRLGNRVPLLRPVPGHNYTIEDTLQLAGGKPVLNHGTYYITEEVFQAAVRRKAELESGRIAYKLIPAGRNALNCIEAITGILGPLNTGLLRGRTATDEVVRFFISSGQMNANRIISPTTAPTSPVLTATQSHSSSTETSSRSGRALASARFYSADTLTSYTPISEVTLSVGGSSVPPGKTRPLGWRLGLSGEIIWIYQNESEFPRSNHLGNFAK